MRKTAYADPQIAAKQRAVVDPQLEDMRKGNPPRLFSVVGEFLSQIQLEPPISLLDAGCGSAYYSEVIEHFTPNTYYYVGVDFNPGMVELAHQLYPELDVLKGDLCALDFPSGSFDVVLSGACIAHMEEWEKALGELVRVAGSWLILHRNPIWLDGSSTIFYQRFDYEADIWVHRFNEKELLEGVLQDFVLVDSQDVCGVSGVEVTRSYLFRRRIVS